MGRGKWEVNLLIGGKVIQPRSDEEKSFTPAETPPPQNYTVNFTAPKW